MAILSTSKCERLLWERAHRFAYLLAWLFAAELFTGTAYGWTTYLTDGNSCVTIQNDSPTGMNSWCVDGRNQLYQQSFWYRVGNAGGESPLNTLPLIATNQSTANSASAIYGNSKMSVDVTYTLSGGAAGSGNATVHEQINIKNLGASPLNLAFFQYLDFDLNGSGLTDTVQLNGGPGAFTGLLQSLGGYGFAQVTLNPASNYGQVGLSPILLNQLNDGSPTTLNNTVGPVSGDATAAFEWTRLLASGAVFQLDIYKSVSVPEPSAGCLALAGLIGGLVKRFRRRR